MQESSDSTRSNNHKVISLFGIQVLINRRGNCNQNILIGNILINEVFLFSQK